jgi:HD-GYP domain
MTFIPIKKLKAGMTLDGDVYQYDYQTCKVAMLRSGQVLTQSYIDRLDALEILGAYINSDKKENSPAPSPISDDLKHEAVTVVKRVYKMFDETDANITAINLKQTMAVSKKLVHALKNDKGVKLSIENLKLYDDYTYNHSLGVSMLSIVIGMSMKLKINDLYELGFCALLHDIGKMGVPIEIISKPARLTPEEFDIVKTHPAKGAEFYSKQHSPNGRILEGILTHHEKYDGTGYPEGKRADEIPLFGRIISIADVYDALTSSRPYRQPSPPPEAIEYIMGSSGSAFDLDIVLAFLKKVTPYPIGSCVKLSNGQIAIIVKQNELHPLRPVIRILSQTNSICDLYNQRDMQNVVIENICNITANDF